MGGPTISHLAPKDKDSFLELLCELTSVSQLDDATFLQIMQRRSMMGCYTFVAKADDGVVLGTASVITQHKFSRGGVVFAQLEDVIVSKAARGQGVGKALLQHINEKMQTLGIYKLAVGAADEDAAAFYWACGFRAQGEYFVKRIPCGVVETFQ